MDKPLIPVHVPPSSTHLSYWFPGVVAVSVLLQ